ncbi:MAG: hypothetical protein FWD12_07890 [Alphaproteobacteria bacterium]|nr:hypothetical protein [Alphaproteobacteria bacterium]
MTLALCGLNLASLVLAWRLGPSGAAMLRGAVPAVPPGGITARLVFLLIAIVGTDRAVALFSQPSCVADKRLRFADLRAARLETLAGAVAAIIFAACTMVVGEAMQRAGIAYEDPARMASAHPDHRPSRHVGRHRDLAFLGPGMGRGDGLAQCARGKDDRGAGVMVPSAIEFLQLLLNDRDMLGPRVANRTRNNWVNWTVIVVPFARSLVLALQVMLPSAIVFRQLLLNDRDMLGPRFVNRTGNNWVN